MKQAIVMVLLLLAACAAQQDPVMMPKTQVLIPVYDEPPVPPIQLDERIIQHEIEVMRDVFLPEEVTVKSGDIVRLIFLSVDEDHNVSMLKMGIEEELDLGEDVIIEFVAGKPGTYLYVNENNARGKLIVK